MREEASHMDCNKEKNLVRCKCTYDACGKKGVCCECIAYHLRSRELPGCCFSEAAEATYDRSFEHFARLVQFRRDMKTSQNAYFRFYGELNDFLHV